MSKDNKIRIKSVDFGDDFNWLNAKIALILQINGKDVIVKGRLGDLYVSENKLLHSLSSLTGFSEQFLHKILIDNFNRAKKGGLLKYGFDTKQ